MPTKMKALPKSPMYKASILSKYVTFWWLNTLFKQGNKRPLKSEDFYEVPSEDETEHITNKLENCWQKEQEKAKASGRKPKLSRAVAMYLGRGFMFVGFMALCEVKMTCNLTENDLKGWFSLASELESYKQFMKVKAACHKWNQKQKQKPQFDVWYIKEGLEKSIVIGYLLLIPPLKQIFLSLLIVTSGVRIELMRISMPYFIGRLISYFVPGTTVTRLQAYTYAGVIILFSFAISIIHHPLFFKATRYGMQLKIALGSLVYRKAMRLSQNSYSKTTTGHIVNLVTSDVQILERTTIFLHQMWLAPLFLLIAAVLSWFELGPWCLTGVFTIFLLAPLQGWMGKQFAILRHKTARMTDLRFKIMNEVISGMRVIKMYNWEEPFSKLVADVRRKEVNIITTAANLRALNGTLYAMCIPVIGIAMFIPYVKTGNSLNPEKVFTVLGLFYSIRVSLTIFLPECVRSLKEGLVSIKRIQNFLQMEDKIAIPNDKSTKSTSTTKEPVVEVENISAKWNENLNTQTLTDISFKVTSGELLMVVGPVGAGKSSLLMAILGELRVSHGELNIQGKISYASQQSWIFSGTVKENILFDQEYEKERYDRVITACALEKDLKLLPAGDDTLVGERGVSLSGGQKARINLARAVYYDADIVLLDDPLSAVDTHVGRQLFDECIRGLLKDRICILVTHQLQYLKGATNIICLHDGRCVGKGTFEELNEAGLDVISLMSTMSAENEPPLDQDTIDMSQNEEDPHVVTVVNGKTPLLEPSKVYKRSVSVVSESVRSETWARKSICDLPSSMSLDTLDDTPEEEETYPTKPEAEKQTTGTVTWRVYLDYFMAGSSVLGLIILALLVLGSQAAVLVSEWWLAEWADSEDYRAKMSQPSKNSTLSSPFYDRDTYILVFGILVVVGVVASLLSFLLLFRLFVMASRNLHNNMFDSVLKAPIYFFDTNPVGRVLNRFAKDVSQMDDLLPSAFSDFIKLSLLTFAIFLLNVVSIPYLLVGAIPITILFGYLRNYYLKTSREIKRLEAINRSPVYSHISASLDGLVTIRAFSAERRFIDSFYDYQNYHSAAYFLFLTTQRWLGFRLDIMCALFMTLATIGSLVTLETGTAISASVVGLCLTYAKMLTGMFQWCTRQSAEVENLMTSVERVIEYSHLEKEAEPSKPLEVPQDWPNHGVISAERLYYTHHKTLPPVLKNLTFFIKSEEKVGIVGRTGAGKSSLLAMLFRLNNPEGLVQIDSLPITDMSLHDLRSAISIIPQDPVLFSGTLRKNLDPFGYYSEVDLWNALEEVQLKEAIEELPEGLDTQLAESGSNFSVGQRQLICLARAILSHNKILVIDEATANVDHNTDSLIQETMRNKFKDCTVLTIAHRLNTIMDSDRVMVLDEGRLVEFDEPYILLQSPKSVFTQLVEQTGKRSVNVLRESARQAYELRHDVASPFVGETVGTPNKCMDDIALPNPDQDPNDDDDDDDNDSDTPFIESKD